jgi:hypothetical protein
MNTPYCLIIYGTKQNDERFRPGTPVPDTHWAYRFVDSYIEYDKTMFNSLPTSGKWPTGIDIVHENKQIVLKITNEFMKQYPNAFDSLMFLVKSNDLTYEFPCIENTCIRCEGHNSCLYNNHKIT